MKTEYLKYAKKEGWLNPTVSASEIENYTYCPVAFVIARSFDIPSTNISQIGTKFHEEQVLLSKRQELKKISSNFFQKHFDILIKTQKNEVKHDTTKLTIDDLIFEGDAQFFEELKQSEIIYPDSNIEENEQKIFIGQNNWFVGKPDYIFRNRNTRMYFVVEEKFQNSKSTNSSFFQNHLNQLRAYMFGINEADYAISYGYLLYWKYDIVEGGYVIKRCHSNKLEKNSKERQLLAKTYSNMRLLLKEESGDFKDEYRNPKKCASCIATQFCSHKTGNLNKFKLPYSSKYFESPYVPFPDALNKKSETEIVIWNKKKYWLYDRLLAIHLPCFLLIFGITDVHVSDIVEYRSKWLIKNDELSLSDFNLKYLKENNIMQLNKSNLEDVLWHNYKHLLNGSIQIYSKDVNKSDNRKEVLDCTVVKINNGKIVMYYLKENKIIEEPGENINNAEQRSFNIENDMSWSQVLSK